jgi:hypothetical protein
LVLAVQHLQPTNKLVHQVLIVFLTRLPPSAVAVVDIWNQQVAVVHIRLVLQVARWWFNKFISPVAGGASTQGNSGGLTGYGFAGGDGVFNSSWYTSGGGGGAGAVGVNAPAGTSPSNGGAGGAGRVNSISGSSVTYSGGGGGCAESGTVGAGGAGGGGAGAKTNPTTNAIAGTVNTGGGGGGSAGQISQGAPAAGGSGVVIIDAGIAAASTTGSPSVSGTIYTFTGSGSITY